MICEKTRELLPLYVDGELDFVRHLEIERHVQECQACAERLGTLQDLHNALQDPNLYCRAPSGLRQRVQSTLQTPRSSRTFPALARGWVALAASVVLAAGMGTWIIVRTLTLPSADQQIAQAVFSSHVRSLMPGHGPDVISSDRHKVKPWFAGKLHFSPPVKDLADHGFPLVGGSLDYLDDHEAAVLTYHRRQHVINLFLWPAPTGTDRLMRSIARNGYYLIHWTQGGFTYWVVSDLNEAELQELARLIREQA